MNEWVTEDESSGQLVVVVWTKVVLQETLFLGHLIVAQECVEIN
jgi:hypothetical protein